MKKNIVFLAIFIIYLILTISGRAYPESLKLDVKEHIFRNGLKLLMLEKHDVPIISARINYKVGSVNEVPGITGVSHLFEHMMFKGTKLFGTKDYTFEKHLLEWEEQLVIKITEEKRKGKTADAEKIASLEKELLDVREKLKELVIKDEIFSIYLRHGATGINAATSADGTYYFCNLPANKLKLWAFLESDRMKNLVLREFYSERDVVMEERRLRTENSPFGLLYEQLKAVTFIAHPYRWPTIGWRSDIQHITKEETRNYFKKYYAPNNAIIVMVGDFRSDDVIKLIGEYFADIPRQPDPPLVKTAEPEQMGERRVEIEFDSNPYVGISYHIPEIGDADLYALDVASSILSAGRTSRLYKSLIEEKRIAIMAHTSMELGKYPSMFTFFSIPRAPHTAEEVESAFYEEVENLAKNPPSDWELQKIKNQIEAEFIRDLDSASGLASKIGYYEVLSDWRYINTFMDRIAEVTAEDVTRIVRKYLTKKNRTVAVIVKKEESITTEGDTSVNEGTTAPIEK